MISIKANDYCNTRCDLIILKLTESENKKKHVKNKFKSNI